MPPSTKRPLRPVVAFVVKPVPRRHTVERGWKLVDEGGCIHQITADAVMAIDFYPANPGTNRERKTP